MFKHLLLTLVCIVCVNCFFAQTEIFDVSITTRKLKREQKRAKKMKFCKAVKITMDESQFADGTHKKINYKVISKHERKNKTFYFEYSSKLPLQPNQLSVNLLKLSFDGITTCNNNEIWLERNLDNCNDAIITINAELKRKPETRDKKTLYLLQNKTVAVSLWESYHSMSNTIISKKIVKDTITVFFKRLTNKNHKQFVYFIAVNTFNKDTLKHLADTTSLIHLRFNSNFSEIKLVADTSIDKQRLIFELKRVKLCRTQIKEEDKKDNRDSFMIIPDPHEKYFKLQQHWQQTIKDRESIIVKPLNSNMFKIQ